MNNLRLLRVPKSDTTCKPDMTKEMVLVCPFAALEHVVATG